MSCAARAWAPGPGRPSLRRVKAGDAASADPAVAMNAQASVEPATHGAHGGTVSGWSLGRTGQRLLLAAHITLACIWIGAMFVIYMANPDWDKNYEEYWWAITEPDGTPRAAYVQLKSLAK